MAAGVLAPELAVLVSIWSVRAAPASSCKVEHPTSLVTTGGERWLIWEKHDLVENLEKDQGDLGGIHDDLFGIIR